MQEILEKVLKKIKPTKEEELKINKKIEGLIKKINKNLKDAKAILGGSGIKGTWLKNAYDSDIFVKFNYKKYKNRSNELSDILEKILKKRRIKFTRLHGSRDYFQIKEKNFTFEIVPILDIKKVEEAKNITDVSPLHADWVNKKVKGLKDDVRLLKQFCKAINVYGAESYIKGFSGYVCEILTAYYKGFTNVIKNASKWKEKTIIDTEGYWKGKNILSELNKSKTRSPIIIIDPVQPDRNAAAAVSRENFIKFIERCREFLKNPSEEFFEIKKINKKTLEEKSGKNHLIIIEAKTKEGKKDIVGCKLIKVIEFIKKELKKHEFNILDYGWEWNRKVLFYFIIKNEKKPDTIKITGPPIKEKFHTKNFKKKHRNTFIEKGRIYAKVKRKFKEPHSLIRFLLKSEYIKDKVSSIRIKNE